MKTILVTGSNGLLGQKIIYSLRNRADVKCIATSKGENRMHAKDGYHFEQLYITDQSQLETIFMRHQPTSVINTAAMTNVDACESKKEECVSINVNAVKSLIQLCEKYDTQLIQLSTDFVFDGEHGPYIEED